MSLYGGKAIDYYPLVSHPSQRTPVLESRKKTTSLLQPFNLVRFTTPSYTEPVHTFGLANRIGKSVLTWQPKVGNFDLFERPVGK